MGYERILTDAIDAELDRLQSEGRRMIADWVTKAVCAPHEASLPSGDDGDFWRHGGFSHTRETVRRRINSRAGDKTEEDDRSPRLPGYTHLQQYYIVKRKGHGDIGVAIHDMTDAEIGGKIALYGSMSLACANHADELQIFMNKRRAERRKSRRAA